MVRICEDCQYKPDAFFHVCRWANSQICQGSVRRLSGERFREDARVVRKEFMAYERQDNLKFCVTYDILSLRLGTSFYDDWTGTLFPDFVV